MKRSESKFRSTKRFTFFRGSLLSNTNKPSNFSSSDRFRFILIQTLRAVLGLVLSFVCFTLWDIGLHISTATCAFAVGILSAGIFLRRNFSFAATLAVHAFIFASVKITLSSLNYYSSGNPTNPSSDFYYYQIAELIFTGLTLYTVGFLSTWCYWTRAYFATLETLSVPALLIWLLSGHRDYNLEVPKVLSEIGWQENWPVDKMIGVLGFSTALMVALYLFVSHNRPVFGEIQTERIRGRSKLVISAFTSALVLILLATLSFYVFKDYESNIGQASEGVGMKTGEGETPLSFQSAVGKTHQPAALVRLENNFSENPWSPMLYMRESALSQFKTTEFVTASPQFDTDVPRIPVGQPFVLPNLEPGPWRTPVTQSVYLLTNHNAPFAIDFPTSIRTLRNPDPQRFNFAYQAESFAPVVELKELAGLPVGDPAWSKDTLAHFLRAPGSQTPDDQISEKIDMSSPTLDSFGEDLRYRVLTKQLTGDIPSPLDKALRIVEHLSRHSIYTRNPGHKISVGEDPVAPYLFATDMRGYCVHFAHAAAFLMRLAGIPARIGTGYLTDLKYAKDGHFLLQLGDRHAWPEIYIYGHGWVVVDITPARAENESSLVPDERLLEELMSKIDPAEHLNDPQTVDTSALSAQHTDLSKLAAQIRLLLILLVCTLLFSYISAKFWLRFAYILPTSESRRLMRFYRSIFSELSDLGLERHWGETRRDYSQRLHDIEQVDTIGLEATLELKRFALAKSGESPTASGDLLNQAQKILRKDINKKFRRWQRFIAFFHFRSLFNYSRW